MLGSRIGVYRLLEELGRGASSVVYLAEAGARTPLVPRGGRVALKVIRNGHAEDQGLAERLLRTAVAASRIDHPNVVRVLDVGVHAGEGGDLHFLAMEYARGRTLRTILDEQGRLSEAFARALALQAARGLDAIHAAGMVHRDLKPSNLLVSEDHRLKVMDLGVAKILDATAMSVAGSFLGTVAYASPEQVAGDAATGPASDLYSLGVVLFEALSGSNPLRGDSPVATIHRHVSVAPPPLRSIVPESSPVLESLLARLLEKSPARRPASASEVARMLESDVLLPGPSASASVAAGTVPSRGWVPVLPARPSFRGRSRDIERVEECLARTVAEGASFVAIRGESGAGRSRFVLECAAALRKSRPDLAAGFVCGGHPEVDMPLTAFGGLLRSLLGLTVAGSGARVASALRDVTEGAADPLLVAVLSGEPSASEAWSVEGERRLVAAAAAFVSKLAERGPVLLAVDDASRLDEASSRALCGLVRAVATRPVLLLGALETGAGGGAARWLDPDARPARFPRVEQLELSPLNMSAIRGIVLEELRAEPSFALVDLVWSGAGGLPRPSVDMARALDLDGRLVRSGEGVELRRDRLAAPLPAPGTRMDERLGALDEEERLLLEMASVLGGGFRAEDLAAATGRPILQALEVLSRLERRHGFLRFTEGRYRFRRGLEAEAVLASVHEDLRRGLHARAAALLRGESAGAGLLRRCAHALSGLDPAEGLDLLPRALREAWGRHGGADGVRFVETALAALDACPGRPDASRLRASLLARRAALQVDMGKPDEARADYEAARASSAEEPGMLLAVELEMLGQLPDTRVRRSTARRILRLHRAAGRPAGSLGGDLHARLAALLYSCGHTRMAARVASVALRLFEETQDGLHHARTLLIHGRCLAGLGRTDEALVPVGAAFEFARKAGSPRLEALAGIRLAAFQMHLGRYREALATLDATHFDSTIPASIRVEELEVRAICLTAVGEYGRAIEAMDLGEDLGRSARGAPTNLPANRALLLAATGSLEAAREAAETSLERMRPRGTVGDMGIPLAALGFISEVEGRTSEAESLLERAAAAGEADERPPIACDARGTLARLRAARDAPGCREFALEALERARSSGRGPAVLEVLAALAELDRRDGLDPTPRLEEAEAMLRERDHEPPWLVSVYSLVAGVRARMGDQAGASRLEKERDLRVEAAAATLRDTTLRDGLRRTVAELATAYARGLAVPERSA